MQNSVVYEQIRQQVWDELAKVRKRLEMYLEPNGNIKRQRKFITEYMTTEICHKIEIVLDSLINSLMKEAQKIIDKAEVKLQNKFYQANFRRQIRDLALGMDKRLKPEDVHIKYSPDPRVKQGIQKGIVPFTLGTVITGAMGIKAKVVETVAGKTIVSFNPYLMAGAIAVGVGTIAISGFIFKKAYDEATPVAFEQMLEDLDRYLESTQRQIEEWLKLVIEVFSRDFNKFCKENGLQPEDI
ncbi:MAG: hypothetical protein D6748_10330 [Calditrichaeota bacterium]|nr:MAG: hypothetical protein D6748_10330 [Calditrichota bacterium]